MKIENVNSTSFGIRCIKPERWNKEVYETLLNSNVAKEIDKKYPKATANYFLYQEHDIANDEPCHTLLFDINLTKDKIWHFWLNSHNRDFLPKHLSKSIKNLTIEKIEEDIAKGTEKYKPIKVDIHPVGKFSIKRFLKNLFN